MSIHPTAIVAATAWIPESCKVGPYCTIGPDVQLGEDCELVSHVVLDGKTRLGARNRVYSFAALGVAPQDLKYRGEATALEIGDDNTFRECVTISRGTDGGGGATRVGDHCLIMAYTHIGHDSTIGNHCILANGATLAGHVTVEDFASVGALCPVHQYCTIGKYAYIGGGTTITQDVLPFSLTSAKRETHAYSLNRIGLQRSGFSEQQVRALHHAYRVLLAGKLNTSQALERLRAEGEPEDCVAYLLSFVERSQRGVIK
ncbi:MAG TPA: acyl-ACP--UDP-N-acetylglucosamine O-acyltransferase [Acidobacteriaceae bacterium]|nr:acyl-ACP--UDP-N-acetylglucosamine O-acyltransferase [Acidobacteriaceae bacterium]